MEKIILELILFLIISAIFYRIGGVRKGLTKWRDWGCSLLLIGLSMFLFGIGKLWWCYPICFLLSWGALSTYGDTIFGYDNFYFHGLLCGLAAIPLIWVGVAWWIVLVRLIICTIGMGLWSKWFPKNPVKELGRGVFFIL